MKYCLSSLSMHYWPVRSFTGAFRYLIMHQHSNYSVISVSVITK